MNSQHDTQDAGVKHDGLRLITEPEGVPNPVRRIEDADGVVCYLLRSYIGQHPKAREDNARAAKYGNLFAAAPELLAACDRLISAMDSIASGNDAPYHWESYNKTVQDAIAIVAKAGGAS